MNKHKYSLIALVGGLIAGVLFFLVWGRGDSRLQAGKPAPEKPVPSVYTYPDFYKGFYLNCGSANRKEKLVGYIERAKKAGLNAVVIDVQTPRMKPAVTPKEHVTYCKEMGIHPIARVVVFPEGLKEYPAPEELVENRLKVAEAACQAGYKEIQFDYIRFNDHGIRGRITVKGRYEYIAAFITKARQRLARYKVILAADVFGRIPLNKEDPIGQKMEVLDRVVDIICPMAYPSHYTWSKKMMADPYYTVLITSQKAKERTRKTAIVSWIQAFKMKVKRSGLSYDKYIEAQLKAVQDAGIKGYFLWNAAQDYEVPLAVCERYHSKTRRIAGGARKEGTVD